MDILTAINWVLWGKGEFPAIIGSTTTSCDQTFLFTMTNDLQTFQYCQKGTVGHDLSLFTDVLLVPVPISLSASKKYLCRF